MNKILDAVVGGWQVSSNYRQTSGLPTQISNGQRWPTNWNLGGQAETERNSRSGDRQHRQRRGHQRRRVPARESVGRRKPLVAFNSSGRICRASPASAIRFAAWACSTSTPACTKCSPCRTANTKQAANSLGDLQRDQLGDLRSGHQQQQSDFSSSNFGKLTTTLTAPRQMQFAGRYTW